MPATDPRIALIHATALSMAPVQAALALHWPQARSLNLLEDSLSVDRARDGALTDAMVGRFVSLARYVQGAGCEGILFTCSAFGPAIEAAGRATGLPTLKPNEAMFEQALAMAQRGRPLTLGLAATFAASIDSMGAELKDMAHRLGVELELRTAFVPEAMEDLAQGRTDDHHRKIAAATQGLAACDAVMLAQFSMAAAQPLVQAALPCPVLTSPGCAVLALRRRLSGA